MLEITIPGYGHLELKYMTLDFNGTLAINGKILPEVKPLLEILSRQMEIFVLTADTFGNAAEQCSDLAVQLHCLESSEHTKEKAEFVKRLGKKNVVSMGNGGNDQLMLQHAALGMGVLGEEGLAIQLLQAADLIVPTIKAGLELVVYPQRLIATLRQ